MSTKLSADIAHWSEEAENWIAWARTPGHDAFWAYRQAFEEFVGAGSGEVLDVGCGEGRVSRLLGALGYDVTAVDPVAQLVDAAREAGSATAYAVASGDSLPFGDARFDKLVLYNVLMDVEDIGTVLIEARRVLKPAGELILSIVHPFADIGQFEEEGSDRRYIADQSYFGRKRFDGRQDKDGLTMRWGGWSQPLSSYVAALTNAGFAITALEEPLPAPEPDGTNRYPDWTRLPLFLWLKAVPQS